MADSKQKSQRMACVGFDQYGSNFNNNNEEFDKWIVMCSMDQSLLFNDIDDFTYASKKCNHFPTISKPNSRKIKIVRYHCGVREELITLEVPKPIMSTSMGMGHEQPKRVDAEKPAGLRQTILKSETTSDLGVEKAEEFASVKPMVMAPLVLKANKEMNLGHKEQQTVASAKPVSLPPMQKSKPSNQPSEDRPTAYQKQSFTVDKKRKHVTVMDDYDTRLAVAKQKLQDSYEQINKTKKQKAIQVIEFHKPLQPQKSKTKSDVKTSIWKKLLAMKTHNKHNKFQPLVY